MSENWRKDRFFPCYWHFVQNTLTCWARHLALFEHRLLSLISVQLLCSTNVQCASQQMLFFYSESEENRCPVTKRNQTSSCLLGVLWEKD